MCCGRHRCIRSHCLAFVCTPGAPIFVIVAVTWWCNIISGNHSGSRFGSAVFKGKNDASNSESKRKECVQLIQGLQSLVSKYCTPDTQLFWESSEITQQFAYKVKYKCCLLRIVLKWPMQYFVMTSGGGAFRQTALKMMQQAGRGLTSRKRRRGRTQQQWNASVNS